MKTGIQGRQAEKDGEREEYRSRYGSPSEFEPCSQRGSLSTVESRDLPSFKEQALKITPISHTACASRASVVCGSCWDHDCYYLLLFLPSPKYMFLNATSVFLDTLRLDTLCIGCKCWVCVWGCVCVSQYLYKISGSFQAS